MSWPLRAITVIAAGIAGHVGAIRSLDHEAKQQEHDRPYGGLGQLRGDQPWTSDGISALGKAVYNDYLEIVKLLLKHKAPVNNENGSWDVVIGGGFPLIEAALNGNADIIEELVRYGAKVEPPGKSGAPLFGAVKSNNPAAVKALLQYKVNVNAVDPEDEMQETPLHKACVKTGNYEIVQLLVDAKANLNAKNSKGLTPLSVAVGQWGQYYIDTRMITPLLDAGAEVNAVDNKKQTALHRAVWDPDALQLLLEHEADVNATDENGTTPLLAALEEKEVEPNTVEYLLDAKADVNVELNHSTPLHLAVKKNLTDVTEMLLAAGADVNVKDAEGKRPFDYAEGELKELLKEKGGVGGKSWCPWCAELKAELKKKLKKLKTKLS